MVTPLDIQLGSESLTIQKNIKIWLRTPMVGNTIGDALKILEQVQKTFRFYIL